VQPFLRVSFASINLFCRVRLEFEDVGTPIRAAPYQRIARRSERALIQA
jgi:hypothetical protein